MQQYSQFGMYGQNPHYTLAETPYARMTGLMTPLNQQQIPGMASYLQPMFVDMNAYKGNSGIPVYPSFIGGMSMMNPEIPLLQPNQVNAWQQQYQNYPPGTMIPPQQQPPLYQPQQQMYPQQGQQFTFVQQYNFNTGQPPQPPPQANFFTSFMQTLQSAFANAFQM